MCGRTPWTSTKNATTTDSSNGQYDPYGGEVHDYGNSNYNVPDRVVGYVLYNFPNTQRGDWMKYLVNDWAVDTAFQAQSGLPYSGTLSSYPSYAALNSSWNGAGARRGFRHWAGTHQMPRDIVQDVRLQKADLVHRTVQGRVAGWTCTTSTTTRT